MDGEGFGERVLRFFGSKRMWQLSFVLAVAGAAGDTGSTWVNFYLLGDAVRETNPLTAPIITSPILVVVEIGWFSIIWLIPFTLRRLSRLFDVTSVMGVVFGASRMLAMIHNVAVLLTALS